MLHQVCFGRLLDSGDLDGPANVDGLLVIEVTGPGLVDEAAQLHVYLFDSDNRLVTSAQVADPRITSYNVCYTKLLRGCPNSSTNRAH